MTRYILEELGFIEPVEEEGTVFLGHGPDITPPRIIEVVDATISSAFELGTVRLEAETDPCSPGDDGCGPAEPWYQWLEASIRTQRAAPARAPGGRSGERHRGPPDPDGRHDPVAVSPVSRFPVGVRT